MGYSTSNLRPVHSQVTLQPDLHRATQKSLTSSLLLLVLLPYVNNG